MTRKQFACIKSAQEIMAQIQKLTEQTAHDPAGAPRAVNAIHEMAVKWNHDFADVDPAWQPPQEQVPVAIMPEIEEDASLRAMLC